MLKKTLMGLAAFVMAVVLVVLLFPWDVLRGPLNRYVSDHVGRRFEVTRHLDVHLGRVTTIRLDGVEFANPEWAAEPFFLKATSADIDIRLWPLLSGKIELPRVALSEPQIGLQIEPDGRRTWALAKDTSDTSAVPAIGAFLVDKGVLRYRASGQGADMKGEFSLVQESASPQASPTGIANASANATVSPSTAATATATATATASSAPQGSPTMSSLPLTYKLAGKWRGEAFTANGRAGGVLQLSKNLEEKFPIEINVATGKTTLKAKGTIGNLAEFASLDATFDIQGRNLEELYKLSGVVLPSTPPYKLRGKLDKSGKLWSATALQGVLGSSDISGALSFDTAGPVALLKGNVQSKILDFEDLRPVVGLSVKSTPASSKTGVGKSAPMPVESVAASAKSVAVAAVPDRAGKVLPIATLDLERIKAMNADVVYSAADIRHVEQLPLDKGSVHVKLTNGVMQLDPISLGVAGGTVAGRITIDGNQAPAALDTRLMVRGVQLNQLFPTIQTTKSSFGKMSGQVDLKGRGNSAAQMLGTSSGDVALLMGNGELSNILLEFMGLDGGEIIKFLLRGDRNVKMRCAAAAFDVKQGLMVSKTIVLDTTDTVINGSGQISLKDETLDILLKPQPKDRSILSLRSPLKIGGTFGAPTASPDKVALTGRAALAIALGAINPLLALAATIETGPGEDADCRSALAMAADPNAKPQPAIKKP